MREKEQRRISVLGFAQGSSGSVELPDYRRSSKAAASVLLRMPGGFEGFAAIAEPFKPANLPIAEADDDPVADDVNGGGAARRGC